MRRLPLLLLLYVTLDFANPLMPGAVRFEAGAVEVVQADRTARAAAAAMPGSGDARESRPRSIQTGRCGFGCPCPSGRDRCDASFAACRRGVQTPSPSPTDDH